MSSHHPSSVTTGRPGSAIYPKSPLGENEEGIPTGRDVAWEPLLDYRRHGVSETTIHGAVAWATGDEVIHSFGGNVLFYGRSMMKPVTMKAFDCAGNTATHVGQAGVVDTVAPEIGTAELAAGVKTCVRLRQRSQSCHSGS